jgi:hypothetical protein
VILRLDLQNVAGRHGGGREIMSAVVKQRKTELENVTWRPEEGHPPQRLKQPMK